MSLVAQGRTTRWLALETVRRRLDYLADARYLGLITEDERAEYKRLCDEERRLLMGADDGTAPTAGVNWK